ncbi:MAG: molybdate ABC transporter substrate-binding protein [Bryobacteraceae bacterium]
MSSLLLTIFLAVPALAQSTLTVAAAADLTKLEPVLDRAFYQTDPGVRVRWVNAASAILSQQIDHGAPYDVFMSANVQYIEKVVSNGKMAPGSVAAYGVGRLGMLWRGGKSHSIKDLTQNWVRFVAIPNPKLAPYGVAAVQALKHEGLWKQVQKKIVYGENVRETLEMFDSGNADVVITSDSLLPKRHPQIIPADWHRPILQKAGIVAASPNRALAEKFMHFLVSPAGQAVFAQFGFSSPK